MSQLPIITPQEAASRLFGVSPSATDSQLVDALVSRAIRPSRLDGDFNELRAALRAVQFEAEAESEAA